MKENIVTYIPLKIYRYMYWKKRQNKNYVFNKVHFDREYADICAELERTIWKCEPLDIQLAAQNKKDEYILKTLLPMFEPVIQRYKENYRVSVTSLPRTANEKIWIFWWSGEDTAPEIVKACIKSIRKNSNGHEVILLDKNNYADYVEFPSYVIEKREKGIIALANFSDMLRLSLLAKYGGTWIDATVFISQPIPKNVFTDQFYTAKKVNFDLLFYSKSRWCSYFLSGSKYFPLFAFARDCFFRYWSQSNVLIDYLLIDYVIGIAYNNFPEIREVFDSIPDNNKERGILMEKINEPYSEKLFQKLSDGETFISKLSWRYGNPKRFTINGKTSNYGYLIEL